MCGRFALAVVDPDELQTHFGLSAAPVGLVARYNIAPTQPVAVIPNAEARTLEVFKWGLIPSWAKDPAIGNSLINARSESVTEKPAFRSAFKRRRCLVLASGFFEWQKTGKTKQPIYIHPTQQPVMALAGLWEAWQASDGSVVNTCTILTTEPNTVMAPIHNRMPVILPPEAYPLWLTPGEVAADKLQPLLKPCPDFWLATHPVSTRVNRPVYDAPDCIVPLN